MEIGTLFPVIGVALILLGVIVLAQRVRFVLGSKVIDGTVVEIQERYPRGRIQYFPVIEYYNEEGHTMERYTDGFGTCPSKYKIGDMVKVRYYSRGSRRELMLNNWFPLWGAPIIGVFMGVVFIIIVL